MKANGFPMPKIMFVMAFRWQKMLITFMENDGWGNSRSNISEQVNSGLTSHQQ